MNKVVLTYFASAIFSLLSISSQAKNVKVVLDISRDVKEGCAYQNGELLKCFRISGGRNKAESFNSPYGKVKFCSFTTTALNIKPQLLQRKRNSKEFKVPLDYFISFDEVRGIGTHAGQTSGYSGACIRIEPKNSKFLYELVRDNSVVEGQKIISSDVHFDVVDNSPNRVEDECECLTKHIRHNSAHKVRADKICSGNLMALDIYNDWLLTMKPKIPRPKKRPDNLIIPEDYTPNSLASEDVLADNSESEVLNEFLVEASSE